MANINLMSVNLQKNIADQQAALKQKVDLEFGSIAKAIEDYKTRRIEFVDQQIVEVVAQTAKEVLGKVINPAEHEELIMSSLEKAKSENILH